MEKKSPGLGNLGGGGGRRCFASGSKVDECFCMLGSWNNCGYGGELKGKSHFVCVCVLFFNSFENGDLKVILFFPLNSLDNGGLKVLFCFLPLNQCFFCGQF